MARKSSTITFIALALFVCFTNTLAAQVNSSTTSLARQIQGDWHGIKTLNKRNLGISFSFDDQGTMRWEMEGEQPDGQRFVVSKEGKYSVSGDIMTTSYDDGFEQEFEITIKNDKLALSSDGEIFVEMDRVNDVSDSTSRLSGIWHASSVGSQGEELAKTELVLRDGKFKMSIKLMTANRTDVLEGEYKLEDGQIVLDSEGEIERLPTKITKDQLQIEYIGTRFQLTRDGKNSNVELLSKK